MSEISNPVAKRASRPKVKSGCVTCKFRRLKCDEGKPACFRCTKSGIRCRGYATQVSAATKINDVARQGLVPIRPAPPTLANREPSYLNLSNQELLYFQDFAYAASADPYGMIMNTARRTARSIESFFWTEAVLQESFTTPCIRHGIVAISALVRSFQSDTDNSQRAQDHEQFALKQYGKAVRSTREFIGISKLTAEHSRALFISSMILAHFDCFYGNRDLATSHMQFARSLLTKETSNLLDDRFVRVLMSLHSVNYSTMGFESEFSYRQAILGKEQIYIPESYSSVEEAVNTREVLVTRANNLYLEIFKYRFTPRAKIPRSAIRLRDCYVAQLRQWDAALRRSTWMYDSKTEIRGHPVLRPYSLRMRVLVSIIKLATSLNEPQSITDELLEPFQYIVSYTGDIIEYETFLSKGKASFNFDIRTTIPLSEVALYCRNSPSLRKEALKLLLFCHRREGAWDSRVIARIAIWKMALEQPGMDESGAIVENARCYGESFEVDRWNKEVRVTCRQNDENMSEGYRIVTDTLQYGEVANELFSSSLL
ncbi:hypothetical protein sscle_09g070270 [Sclerotinia sclerotiorum 1980 UF-70]|uniref:Zn(2)-C6 fungal-type domain-containing protein n=2 Tax=Sclerotinia sclerotiorum (strain ATCC 18683 / 1980 / Ss-1) TaxID=665079 RepID=A0A1D9QBE3_SCLS1|nr:hypothetical protein sscle_09g070270 [Sclerotinia sclerotiorum 1980 UF-70]